MGIGIVVCGPNGSGKSAVGKALANKFGFRFIDNENLSFPKTDPNYIYASARSRDEVEKLLMDEVRIYKNFVFAAVKGDYGKDIVPLYLNCPVIRVDGTKPIEENVMFIMEQIQR